MAKRPYTSGIHAIAGGLAFLIILSFQLSSLTVELFGDVHAVAAVKRVIGWSLFILVPMIAATGGSGFAMVGIPKKGAAAAKFRRMRMIGVNGVAILVPAAIFLAWKAGRAELDGWFAAVQALEFLAGLANLTLMGLNIRDGMRMTGRLTRPASGQRVGPNSITPAIR